MNAFTDSLITMSIPITATDRQQAAAFAAQQLPPEKAAQVYRNTISVLVGARYLQLLAISSDVQASQSWDRIERSLKNVADLYLPELDRSIECRSITSDETHCFVPEEVQTDRIGYLIIQLDAPYREGIILGFMPQVTVTQVPLSYVQSLDLLIDRLTARHLGSWLKHKFEQDWLPRLQLLKPPKQPIIQMSSLSTIDASLHRSIEQLYQQAAISEQTEIAPISDDPVTALVHLIQTTQKDEIRWQAAQLLWDVDPDHPVSPVISVRDLGMYLNGHAIALMVGVLPKADGRQLILLRLYPFQAESCLPKALKLAVFDDQNNVLVELESRDRDQYIQFKLTAEPRDAFKVRVSLNEASVVENFLV